MSDIKLSKRYAKSLFDYSKEKNTTQQVYLEIQEIRAILEENIEVLQFFKNPLYDLAKKNNFISSLFKDFSIDTKFFLTLLSNKKRLNLINEIALQFIYLNNKESDNNILNLTIAQDLSDSIVAEIIEKGKKILNFTGIQTEVRKKIDPSIIGGFILQIKDKQLDASVKNRLADLKNHFNLHLYESHL